jgi:uncharacterized protein (TIGR02996 family)
VRRVVASIRRAAWASPLGKKRLRGFMRPAAQLRAPRIDPTDALVLADWLDDNGEPAAAANLRAAFTPVEG